MAGEDQVTGVRETIATLRRLEPALARQAVKDIKAPALTTAAQLRAIAPAVPLSHMGYTGPVKATANYGGKPKGDTYPLVRIRLTGNGWTVASDMARQASPGESMVRNLTAKYGPASRYAWPTVEQRLTLIRVAIARAVKEVERTLSRELKGG